MFQSSLFTFFVLSTLGLGFVTEGIFIELLCESDSILCQEMMCNKNICSLKKGRKTSLQLAQLKSIPKSKDCIFKTENLQSDWWISMLSVMRSEISVDIWVDHNIFLHSLICQNMTDILKMAVGSSYFHWKNSFFKKKKNVFTQSFYPEVQEGDLKIFYFFFLPGDCLPWEFVVYSKEPERHISDSHPLRWKSAVITLIALFCSHLPMTLSQYSFPKLTEFQARFWVTFMVFPNIYKLFKLFIVWIVLTPCLCFSLLYFHCAVLKCWIWGSHFSGQIDVKNMGVLTFPPAWNQMKCLTVMKKPLYSTAISCNDSNRIKNLVGISIWHNIRGL